MRPTPPARLEILQASEAAVAVLFRRGPSRYVEVIRWNMRNDRFERGDWFKGRIYVARSDLSSDGELLVYFALDKTPERMSSEYTYAWTAVSRPPWLAALALWPRGSTWFGGGMFTGPRTLVLSHPPDEAEPHPEHKPTGLEVSVSKDPYLYWTRLERDGWTCVQLGERRATSGGYETIKPQIHTREHPRLPFSISMYLHSEGRQSTRSFHIEDQRRTSPVPPGRVDWVDWDSRGRAFALVDGAVWIADVEQSGVGPFERLIDFSADTFEVRDAPESARRW
jgi:hypothetical protein